MTDRIRVRFLPDDIVIEATFGDSLLDAALNAGVFIPAACGGSGACGQCKVKVVQGQVKAESTEKIRPQDRNQGYVLACQTKLVEDVTIEVPMAKVGRKVIPRDEADRMKTMARPMESPITPEFNPMTISVLMNPAAPRLEDNSSDYERIIRELKVNHNLSPVVTSLDVLKVIPNKVREQDWQFAALLKPEHLPGIDPYYQLLNIYPGRKAPLRTAMAVDIGTTSLWGELINIETGEVLARSSRYNPQISMGDDVISRIVFALKKEGSEKLQQVVVQGLNEIINETLEKSGTSRNSINYMVTAGNTVMTHLFLGLYPRFLRQTPYVPVAQNIGPVPAEDLGLDMPEGAFVNVFPGVASYVGGDIVSGVLANGMWDSDLMTLFIDIGTNGEIVAGNRDLLMTASCSAGPAFEGGGLQHGMRAAPGAIEGVLIDPETFEPMIKTIDAKPAIGICGSGIINIISQMLRIGMLNQNAKFAQDLGTDRIRKGTSGSEYVICKAKESGLNEDIVLTEVDLDNILRAKAAMFSGYACLLEKIGLSVEELDRVIIAGAFGSFINLDHAVTIGLLPDIPRDKFSFIGNSSLKGARLAVIDRRLMEKSGDIARSMMNVELSEDPAYMDNFMAALFLPHTRMQLFPSVRLGVYG
ncbi:MAG: ASKHA domain-containing protein [Deltaproteobacteria bacterium]|nr:ASKHA domain-containing protein [Deltaproteobacteria bacterium]